MDRVRGQAVVRTARFVEGDSSWPHIRQTPRHDGVFGGTKFVFGAGTEPTDWLVALNQLPAEARYCFPRHRSILLWGEPPLSPRLDPDYAAQFGTMVSVDPRLKHPGARLMTPLVPWHVGIRAAEPARYAEAMTFAELEGAPVKTRLCSCIASNLTMLPGHRLRVGFVARLRERLGDRIDFFGRGINPVADKDAALAPYRYHIAIENSSVPRYWTEKLADPFLRNCFPIYYGAPDIGRDFDPAALATIDIADPDAAIERIAGILASDLDQRAGGAVEQAKQRVLWEHNMFARLDGLMAELEARGAAPGPAQEFRPEAMFRHSGPWYRRARKRLARQLHRVRYFR